MLHDGLWDVYNNKHMGNCAEKLAKKENLQGKIKINLLKIYMKAQKAQRINAHSN